MLNYLYYKLYQAALKSSVKDIPAFTASAWVGGLISANILLISAFLSKLRLLPFIFSSSKQAGLFTLIIMALALLYYRKGRRELILDQYSQESDNVRRKGNAIVAVYVALSFLLILAVAYFRPGKLYL